MLRALLAAAVLLTVSGCRNETTYKPLGEYEDLDADYGSWLSMDTAPDGSLAVAYYDRSKGGLGFATGQPQASGEVHWTHEEVDGYTDDQGMDTGDRGMFASMKVTPTGDVWVAYHDASAGTLRVAHRTFGPTWTTEVADAGSGMAPVAGMWASLALDPDGNPVVAHFESGKKELRITKRDGDAWSSEVAYEAEDWTGPDPETGETITRPAAAGEFCRLLVHDTTHYVAFYDAAKQSLELIEGFPGAWAHSTVYEDVNVGQWPSIWTDGTEMYIAFQDVQNQDLLLATRSGGTWDVEVVDSGEFVGADTEVFVRDGELNILYFDGRTNDMKLAKKSQGAWTLETVAGADSAVGFHNEVVETPSGWFAASYDFTHRNLFVTSL